MSLKVVTLIRYNLFGMKYSLHLYFWNVSLWMFVYVVEMNFFAEHRAYLNEHHFCTHSYLGTQNRFTNAFANMPVPNTSTIKKTIDRFQNYYTISDI